MLRTPGRRIVRVAGLAGALALVPTASVAQSCEVGAPAAGSTDIGAGLWNNAPALSARHYRSGVWAGVSAGHFAAKQEWSILGSDATGTFVGSTRVEFLGAGAEVGYGLDLGSFALCAAGGVLLRFERSSVVERFYTNPFGQTIGFEREEIDSGLRTRTWNLDLSLDRAVAETVRVGAGVFVEQTNVLVDGVSGSVETHRVAGITAGMRFLPTRLFLLHAGYRLAVATSSGREGASIGVLSIPDGRLVLRLGWIL